MSGKQNYILIGIIVLVTFAGSYLFLSRQNASVVVDNNITVEGINLYYTNSCPHCKNVQDYIDANGIRQKISFQEKEIGSNQSYNNEMSSLAATCGLATSQVGVPFLWDGKKCYIGDKEVIGFFQKRANSE